MRRLVGDGATRRQPRSVRTRCPAADTESSQHDFHCQRAKDESHYTDEDGRALPTDHTQDLTVSTIQRFNDSRGESQNDLARSDGEADLETPIEIK